MTEKEKNQKEREQERKYDIQKTLRRTKIKKFGCLIVTSLIIAVYFAVTSYYLNEIHIYERHYT